MTTVSKLMTLFHSMSLPSFLMAEEFNFQLTTYLMETFNNIIHYHYAENVNLIYSIVLHHDYFEKLDKLTFEEALQEVDRVRRRREAKDIVVTDNSSADSSLKIPEGTSDSTSTSAIKELDTQDNQNESGLLEIDTNIASAEDKVLDETSSSPADNKDLHEQATTAVKDNTQSLSSSKPAIVPVRQDSESTTFNIQTHSGFIPTNAWMAYWKERLPLATVLALVKYLVPKVEEKCKDVNNNITLEELMQYLQTLDVTKVIPEQGGHSILVRRFQWGEALVIWFRSMMWGQNYVCSMREYGAWNGTHVKLFQIKEE